MKESILKDFFKGAISPQELKEALSGSLHSSRDVTYHYIEDMDEEFEVLPEHLIKICDAVINGVLDPIDLCSIGFCIISSDYFNYNADTEEGKRVGDVVIDWADYSMNYKLNIEATNKFKERLLSGKDLFAKEDHYLDRHGRPKK